MKLTKNEKTDTRKARMLRQVFHGKRTLRPSWDDMDGLDQEPWMRLARYFRKHYNE